MPAIQKWSEFENHASILLTVCIALSAIMKIFNVFSISLFPFGLFIGFLICAAYYFALTENITAAAVVSILVALFCALAVAVHISLPLWIITLNGFTGVVLVVALIAIWTKRY
jgi:hypothetical protein